MATFYLICQWLLVLSFFGFLGTIAWIVMAALKIKTSLMADAKRLYEPPMRSVKGIMATGKSITFQEKARFGRVSTVVKGTAAVVKDTAKDVQTTAKTIHPSDLKPVATDFQYVVRTVTGIGQFIKLLNKLSAEPR